MYVERVIIPLEDVQDYVMEYQIESIEQKLDNKAFLEWFSKILDEIYCYPHQEIRKEIVKMWAASKIYNCKYSYQHIGTFFGYSNETIRTIIDDFKQIMKKNGWREVLRREGWNGSW